MMYGDELQSSASANGTNNVHGDDTMETSRNDSGGFGESTHNDPDEGDRFATQAVVSGEEASSRPSSRNSNRALVGGKRESKKPHQLLMLSEEKRRKEKKNQREKERAFRLSQQICSLKEVLVKSGVVDESATKSAVLAEAASYIQTLEEEKRQAQLQRNQSLRNVNERTTRMETPSRPYGFPVGAAATISQSVAAQSQPSFARLSSLSEEHSAAQQLAGLATMAMAAAPKRKTEQPLTATQSALNKATNAALHQAVITNPLLAARGAAMSASLEEHIRASEADYVTVFESCPFPMAIANLGGKFLDCNKLFRQCTGHANGEDLLAMTFFNLTHRQDLQVAFDSLSRMITSPLVALGLAPGNNLNGSSDTFTVMGTTPNKGLRIDAIKNAQGTLRCLCILLIDMRVACNESNREPQIKSLYESKLRTLEHKQPRQQAPK
uniref:BHLH domain-containing protein n=1 Tax=Grammatophora oceanica TaxID=210454 RepID=A0A7S1VS59_9STRA